MNIYKKAVSITFCILSFCLSSFAEEVPTQNQDWDGELYLKNSTLQYQWANSYIQKFQLNGNEKILDIGCGDGRITAMIAKSVPKGFVVGIDPSDSMLQTAQNLKDKIAFANLDFLKRDAMDLHLTSEFDFIVSFSCFHWIADHFRALQELEKALKPGGKVFLYFAPDHGRDRFDHAIKKVVESTKWAPYFSDFSNPFTLVSPSQFATYAEEANLLIKRIEIITVDEIFSSKDAFAAWMTGWMSYLKQLPKKLHKEFLEEIIDCYLEKHPIDSENQLHYIDYWMEVELLKPCN